MFIITYRDWVELALSRAPGVAPQVRVPAVRHVVDDGDRGNTGRHVGRHHSGVDAIETSETKKEKT
jgi:hypothetical protein